MECSLQKIAQMLTEAQTIVITSHINPDGDSLGSQLALFLYLKSWGKNVKMLLDDDIPSIYRFLPGWEAIQKPQSKVVADVLLVLDASDVERIGAVKETVHAPIINIDHHLSNTKFADYWFINSQAAATGEIVFQLLHMLPAAINKDIALCLYTAIATDCGFFRYANTSAATMRFSADLIEFGVQPHVVSEALETRPLKNITMLSQVLDTLELYENGQIATITLTADMMEQIDNTEGFINYPRCIEGVEVALMFKVFTEGFTRISFRSKNIDVSKIALHFNGGGHARAAGCTITGSFSEIKTNVIGVIKTSLQEKQLCTTE